MLCGMQINFQILGSKVNDEVHDGVKYAGNCILIVEA